MEISAPRFSNGELHQAKEAIACIDCTEIRGVVLEALERIERDSIRYKE